MLVICGVSFPPLMLFLLAVISFIVISLVVACQFWLPSVFSLFLLTSLFCFHLYLATLVSVTEGLITDVVAPIVFRHCRDKFCIGTDCCLMAEVLSFSGGLVWS